MKFPCERLYATVYMPGEDEPADFDQEAFDLWSSIFEKAGLNPSVHVVTGGKKDNFWMMGETGLAALVLNFTSILPPGDSGQTRECDSNLCIEIWNLVFIQFNADKEGNFPPLRQACGYRNGIWSVCGCGHAGNK